MGEFEVLLTVFVIACFQCYLQCQAERNMENRHFNRTAPPGPVWSASSMLTTVEPDPVETTPVAVITKRSDVVKPTSVESTTVEIDPVILFTAIPEEPTMLIPTTVEQDLVKPTIIGPNPIDPNSVKPLEQIALSTPTTVGPNSIEPTSVKPLKQLASLKPTTVGSNSLDPTSVKPLEKLASLTPTIVGPNPVDPTSVKPLEELAPLKASDLREDPDPCQWTTTKRPKFDVPGLRISEAKCNEFLWEYKLLQEEKEKDSKCTKSKRRRNIRSIIGVIRQDAHDVVSHGRITISGEFPHMGELGWRGPEYGDYKFKCGATLISENFLLTAAHCSKVPPGDGILYTTPEIVRLGVKTLNTWDRSLRYDHLIAQIIVHPQFAPPKKYYDIALVELKYEVTLGFYIWPACLWTQHDTSPLGNRSLVSGWGYIDTALIEIAGELQVAELDMIDSAVCDWMLRLYRDRNFKGLQSHQLCAGGLLTGADACPGDSGGPLQVKIPSQKSLSYVIGVTSFGRGCGRKNSPGVYTRISSFIDWIEDIVWPK